MPLQLRINGEIRSVLDDANPAALDKVLTALSVRKELIAVAVNDIIVPHTLWDQTFVSDGDRVEIVHFVGGGSARSAQMTLVRRGSRRSTDHASMERGLPIGRNSITVI